MRIFKKKLLLFLLLPFTSAAFGKDNKNEDSICTVGKNLILQKDITARRYSFNKIIHKIYFDSVSNNLTLHLSKGEIVAFSLDQHSIKWTQKINYNKDYLLQKKDILIQLSDKENYRLNMKTGYKDFPLKNSIFWIDVPSKTGIGYAHQTKGLSNSLMGINLQNGNIKWQREIIRDYSWNYICAFNDSTLLFGASGLHTINIKTGQGWDYKTETGENSDKNRGIGKKIGHWNGHYARFDGTELICNISSNILKDSSYLYYASKERLAKLDRLTGKIIWSYELKEGEASSSQIFFVDNTLVMLNTGYFISLNHQKIAHGNPFIAAFDTATGQILFKNKIAVEEGNIVSYTTYGNKLFLLFLYKITSYDLHSGQLISQKTMPENRKNENVFFGNKNLYENLNDTASPNFRQLDSTKQFVITNEHHLLEFDNDLNFIRTTNDTLLYAIIGRNNSFKIISKIADNKMYIIESSTNHVVAHFIAPFNSVLIKNKLYGIDDNTLIETDLSEILK